MTGQRELYYAGRASTVYQGRLKFRCLSAAQQRGLGKTIQRDVEYSTLNANEKAEKAALDVYYELKRIIDDNSR